MFEPGSGEDDGSVRYIACRACGTRIRADRESCLRCGEPLEAAPETVSLQTISSGRPLAIAVGIALIIAIAAGAIWVYRPRIEQRDAPGQAYVPSRPAQPAGAPRPAPAAAPATAPAVSTAPDAPADSLIDATALGTFAGGDPAAVRDQYEQAAAQNPNDASALDRFGRVLAGLGERPAAIDKFARASMLEPNNWVYYFDQAYLFAVDDEWPKALAALRQAARLAPDQYAVQFDLAVALHKTGDESGAVPQYQQAMRLAPGDARAHVALGICLEKAGRVPEARDEYQRYLDAAPSAPDAGDVKTHLDYMPAAGSAP
jgi:Flp pilus assembly protein TadD